MPPSRSQMMFTFRTNTTFSQVVQWHQLFGHFANKATQAGWKDRVCALQLGYTNESLSQSYCQSYCSTWRGGVLLPCADQMWWHLLRIMIVARKIKRERENLNNSLPTSNTALWNESALFLESFFFFFSVIHSLSGRTSHLCEDLHV